MSLRNALFRRAAWGLALAVLASGIHAAGPAQHAVLHVRVQRASAERLADGREGVIIPAMSIITVSDYVHLVPVVVPDDPGAFEGAGVVSFRNVQPGALGGPAVELVGGLREGEYYIVEAGGRLAEKLNVRYTLVNPVPRTADDFCYRANFLFGQGAHERALEDYTAAIKLDRRHYRAHLGRGDAYTAQRRFGPAIEDYSRAVKIKGSPEAYIRRSSAYLTLGDARRALGDARRAVKRHPGSPEAFAHRAELSLSQGDVDGALADAREAVRIAPDSVETRFVLARALLRSGKTEEAAEHLRKASELGSSRAAAALKELEAGSLPPL